MSFAPQLPSAPRYWSDSAASCQHCVIQLSGSAMPVSDPERPRPLHTALFKPACQYPLQNSQPAKTQEGNGTLLHHRRKFGHWRGADATLPFRRPQVSAMCADRQVDEIGNGRRIFWGISHDVTEPEAMASRQKCHRHLGPVDCAILNAGIYVPQDTADRPGRLCPPHGCELHGRGNALPQLIDGMLSRDAGRSPSFPPLPDGPAARAAYGPRRRR